jgi:hypothetical protein
MSSYPQTVVCTCGCTARLIPVPLQVNFTPDWVDSQTYDYGAGRRFSSRTERKNWMRSQNVEEMCAEDVKRESEYRTQLIEEKHDRLRAGEAV